VILLPQGAVIHMEHRVHPGEELMLFNPACQQEVSCSVFGTLAGPDGKMLVEVEFTQPQKTFWPVSFPAWSGKGTGNAAGNHGPRGLTQGRNPAMTNSRT